jgi:endonuclease/exonuclease/phosphatase (EEP) superfamily protein YafD
LQLAPTLRVSKLDEWIPMRRPEDFAQLAEGWRRAGLPERRRSPEAALEAQPRFRERCRPRNVDRWGGEEAVPALEILGLATAAIVVAATLLPLWRTDRWWVRALDFPRLQLAAIGLGAIALLGPSLRDGSLAANGAALLVAACIAWHCVRVWPYLPCGRLQVPPARKGDAATPRIRLVVANVLQKNRRADELIRIISDAAPDLVLAVETDAWWAARLTAGLGADWRPVISKPLDNTYGILLLARRAVRSAELRFLVDDDVPSILAAIPLAPDVLVHLYGIHPRPPRPAQDTAERDAELVLVAREAKQRGGPAIVAGDLNDVAWSRTTRLFQRISGFLDPRRGRGLYCTFHARVPFLRWPLDHIFHSAEFRLVELRRLPFFGSDHFPVLAELSYEPAKAGSVDRPQADQEDRAEAQDKVAAARAP